MSDIVIIPTYDRPELLWLCAENLAKADGIESKRVIIHEDYHSDKPKSVRLQEEISETVEFVKRVLSSVEHVQVRHTNYGCSYNFIDGWRVGLKSDAKFVYHIEDDCMVTKDYFRFAEAAHELCPDAFVVCGNARPQSRTSESNLVHLTDKWFQTFALSFRREQLGKVLLPNYEDYKFSKHFEFDTYVMTWMVEHGEYSVSPNRERVFCYGYFSYHMPGQRLPGKLAERVEYVRAATKDPSILSGGYVKDFLPYVEPASWTTLKKRSSLGQRPVTF